MRRFPIAGASDATPHEWTETTMSENTSPETPETVEAPEVEAHSASVLDLQGTTSVDQEHIADGNCISVLSVVENQK
ncbi:predicted protein [Streptomyces albidoflavus]|nr:predicted protein [Streptomyces albidoflavus]